jgi:hypothetical protein
MKKLKTKRRFYNKWIYKISLKISGNRDFRLKPLDEIIEKSKNKPLVTLCQTLIDKPEDSYGTRVEGDNIDLYFNNPDYLDETVSKFPIKDILATWTPEENCADLLEKPRNIIANKLPHDRFGYKVYILPHKVDRQEKERFISWADSQEPRILISKSVKEWFIKTEWNWDRRYMYVEDEKTLLMLKLKNPDIMGSVYSYTINTR